MEKIQIYTVTALSSSKERNLHIRSEIFDRYYIPYLRDLGIFKDGSKCIELGSGQGHKLKKLIEAFPNVSFAGLEISSEMMLKAKEKLPDSVLLNGDILNMSDIPDNSKDIVCLFQVMHHLDSKSRNMAHSEIIRILKTHGHIVVIDSFRVQSNKINQLLWDFGYKFYAVLSQYPAESLAIRTREAIMSILAPSRYATQDFSYFPLTHKDVLGDGHDDLELIKLITPKVLCNTVPCISDIMVFQKK